MNAKRNSKRGILFAFTIIFLLLSVSWIPAFSGSIINPKDILKNESHIKRPDEKYAQIKDDNETNFYAVIAACSRYQNPRKNIPKRPFPPISEPKLKALYSSLLTYPNWKEENIILLLNEDATRENIILALENMSERVTPNDVFLFQWQGHGSEVIDDDGDEPDGTDEIICPYDTDNNQTVYLSDDDLNYYFSQINAKGQIIIIESCLSGGLVHGEDDIDQDGRIIILSTLPNTIGRATPLFGFPMNFGLATSLNQQSAIAAEDANNDGSISIQECFNRAKFIIFGENSLFWMILWLLCLVDTKDLVSSVKIIAVLFFYLEYLTFFLSGHSMLNFPHLIDNVGEDLPLVTIQ